MEMLKSQLQQSQIRQKTLRNINDQLTKIIQNASNQPSLITRMNQMQTEHTNQIQSLKLQILRQQSQFDFQSQKLRQANKQLQENCEQLESQVQFLKRLIHEKDSLLMQNINKVEKYQKMIKNQESLLDDFKRAGEQQMQLQRQLLKATFQQKQLKLKQDYSRALKAIQKNYQQKINNLVNGNMKQNLKQQMKEIKQNILGKLSNMKKNKSIKQLGFLSQVQSTKPNSNKLVNAHPNFNMLNRNNINKETECRRNSKNHSDSFRIDKFIE